MKRIAIGVALVLALAACGGSDERQAQEATEVTVESAPPATGAPGGEETQVTVESAETGKESAGD